MNNNVNMRQLALILLVIIPGGKYLTLPAMLARQTGTDSWIVIATMLLIDLICLCFLLWAVGLNHRYELKDILNMTVGRPVAKIVFVIFLAFVLIRMVTLMTSAYDVFSASFAVNTNWLGFFIPVFLLMTFSLSRGFNAIARVNEALFTIIIICLICMLVYPATNANWEELYPVATDIGKLKETMEDYSFWFSDYVFIYFLLSDIKSQKNVAPVTLICFITGSLFAVFMNTVFCALYGNTAQFYNPAMSKSQSVCRICVYQRTSRLVVPVSVDDVHIYKTVRICLLRLQMYVQHFPYRIARFKLVDSVGDCVGGIDSVAVPG